MCIGVYLAAPVFGVDVVVCQLPPPVPPPAPAPSLLPLIPFSRGQTRAVRDKVLSDSVFVCLCKKMVFLFCFVFCFVLFFGFPRACAVYKSAPLLYMYC